MNKNSMGDHYLIVSPDNVMEASIHSLVQS
jgi:hypothetical protein